MGELLIVVFHCAKAGDQPLRGELTGPMQIELLFRSTLAVHQEAKFVVLTTEDTDLSGITIPFSRVNDSVDYDRLMFERTRMQRQFLASIPISCPIAFLDTDILFVDDLLHIFEDDFDIGLTWRPHREMPFNGGVILANDKRPDAVLRFFDLLEKQFSESQKHRLEWYGDQYAIAEVVGVNPASEGTSDKCSVDGVRYKFLPSTIYNYSPPDHSSTLFKGPKGACLVHFKGARKRLMLPFWKYWMAKDAVPNWWRLLRAAASALVLSANKGRFDRDFDKHRRRFSRFNLNGQNDATWEERARLAAELVSSAVKDIEFPRVVDVGCGNERLHSILREMGLEAHYRGFDLLPQNPTVRRLDISTEEMPEKADIATMLGVIEYLDNPVDILRRLKRSAPLLVVSHATSDLRKRKVKRIRKLRWRTHLSGPEFETVLAKSGYGVIVRRITPDNSTSVWLCHAGSGSYL